MESYLTKIHLTGKDAYGKPVSIAARSLDEAVEWAERHTDVEVDHYGFGWPAAFRPVKTDDAFAAWKRRQDAADWRAALRALVHDAIAATRTARAA